MDTAPAIRTLRAAIFAALLVLLAGLGQVLLTGRPLPLGTLAVAGAAVFAVAFALAGRERGHRAVAAVFLPLELGLSALFDLAQSTCHPLPPGAARGLEPLLCGGGELGGLLLGHDLPRPVGLALLLLLHTTLALAAAYWLRSADAALSGLARTVRILADRGRRSAGAAARLLALLTAPRPARPVVRVPFPRASRVLVPAESVRLRPAVRRGPPARLPAPAR
ncbi:hypothetical protein ACFP3U_27265 [Kitasatospora misakiensis]|uniref:Integral membrane protein n=1 Tax=Kitasatospora misakiensis TaxID=67330 RepID=A0ABW0XAD2_9ACTN